MTLSPRPMGETFNNVPMSESMAAKTEKDDSFWNGPKLIVLSFVTLGFCVALLWAMAEGVIGPTQHEADYGHERHFLQPGGGPID